jgi:hypothetical protein
MRVCFDDSDLAIYHRHIKPRRYDQTRSPDSARDKTTESFHLDLTTILADAFHPSDLTQPHLEQKIL